MVSGTPPPVCAVIFVTCPVASVVEVRAPELSYVYLVVLPFGVLIDASSAFDHVLVHVRVWPPVEYGRLVVVVSLRLFVNTSPLLSYVKLVVRPGVATVAGRCTHVESYAIVVV